MSAPVESRATASIFKNVYIFYFILFYFIICEVSTELYLFSSILYFPNFL